MPIYGETVTRYDNRPMVSIYVHRSAAVRFMVDTGFTEEVSISLLTALEAGRDISEDRIRIKARRDGEVSRITLGTCKIDVDWFGTKTEVLALIGRPAYGRLGVAMLRDCTLQVDWPRRSVVIDRPGPIVPPLPAAASGGAVR